MVGLKGIHFVSIKYAYHQTQRKKNDKVQSTASTRFWKHKNLPSLRWTNAVDCIIQFEIFQKKTKQKKSFEIV